MGFVRKVLGVKPKPAAPKYHVDPERAKRMAAAQAAAQNKPLGRSSLKTELEDETGQTRAGLVI